MEILRFLRKGSWCQQSSGSFAEDCFVCLVMQKISCTQQDQWTSPSDLTQHLPGNHRQKFHVFPWIYSMHWEGTVLFLREKFWSSGWTALWRLYFGSFAHDAVLYRRSSLAQAVCMFPPLFSVLKISYFA